jgi:hypothetical protein
MHDLMCSTEGRGSERAVSYLDDDADYGHGEGYID